jgi:hypothetical protein
MNACVNIFIYRKVWLYIIGFVLGICLVGYILIYLKYRRYKKRKQKKLFKSSDESVSGVERSGVEDIDMSEIDLEEETLFDGRDHVSDFYPISTTPSRPACQRPLHPKPETFCKEIV